MDESLAFRVLILAPIGRDASASADLLRNVGLTAHVADDLPGLLAGLKSGAGAAFVAEEALFNADLAPVQDWIARQPGWSDFPFVVLTSHLDHSRTKLWRQKLADKLQNVSMMERPLQAISLTSAIQVALRARHRQYEVKALMEAQKAAAENLEALVIARTQELEKANAELKNQMAERERVEASLRQSQKMEAVGQLTGGLAHDFNNLLTAISGGLELTRARLSQGKADSVDRYIYAAQGAVKKAASLTHRLLAFSRRQTLEPKPTSVNRLVADMEELIRRTVGPAIDIEVVSASGLWTTLVDRNQLENALLNLCLNARDAMPEGGRLTIETANRWLNERTARELDVLPGQYVSLSVVDTGIGMAPDVAAHAFDPFYTTKPLGQGTGLGLSMIYGFARQSGGQIRISSEVDRGTTMCLYLPRHGDEPTAADDAVSLPGPIRSRGEGKAVLVIDDESSIRMLVADVLTDAGYSVIEAANGQAGLRILQSTARVDFLISDIGLPGGLNGRQVADAARKLRPGLRVLFITGYAENALVGDGQLEKGMHVLAKPFEVERLATKIHELINN